MEEAGASGCLRFPSPCRSAASVFFLTSCFCPQESRGLGLGTGTKIPVAWRTRMSGRVQSWAFVRSVVFAVQGESVWVFECRYLLSFKGLLALPWGYRGRNSCLCFSPACRLLTGTTRKPPAHSVLCVSMFAPMVPSSLFSVLFFTLYFFVLHSLANHPVVIL